MKRKIFSVLFALVLACSLGLVTAVPAAAAPGAVISSTNVEGPYSVGVEQGFSVRTTSDTAYALVLFKFVVQDAVLADITSFQYYDWEYTQAWHDMPLVEVAPNLEGYFGPETGFPMTAGWDVTTLFRINFVTAGTYPVTLSLVNMGDGEAVITTVDFSIVVKASAPNSVASSTMIFEGTLTDNDDGTYSGMIPMVDELFAQLGDFVAGYDLYAREKDTAWFGNDPDKTGPLEPDWDPLVIADHDAFLPNPEWSPDTPDWYQYSVKFWNDEGVQKWRVANHSGSTAISPWADGGGSGEVEQGVPMSGTMDWNTMYATETDVGEYLPPIDPLIHPEIPGGAAAHGGGAQAWDMDWSWGSEVVPLEYPGFDVAVTDLGGNSYRVTLTPAVPDTNYCTIARTGSIYGTIQAAIDAASSGDTILVAAGTYAGAVVNEDLTITGAAGGGSFITSGVPYKVDSPLLTGFRLDADADGAEISNFTINGDYVNKFWFGVFARNADSVIVDSLTLDDMVQGITNWGGSGWEITNNVISETYPTYGGGIAIYLGADPTDFPHCDNNLVQGNTITTSAEQSGGFTGAAICLWFDERDYVEPDTQSITGNEIKDNSITATGLANQTGIEIGVGGLDGDDNPVKVAACLGVIHDNTVTNNTIDNAEWGLYTYVTTDLTVSGNTIKNCSDCGIYMKDDHANCLINYNDIYGNTNYGLNNTDGATYSTTVNATYNWWGDVAGPQHASNPYHEWAGNAVSDNVDYLPWLIQTELREDWNIYSMPITPDEACLEPFEDALLSANVTGAYYFDSDNQSWGIPEDEGPLDAVYLKLENPVTVNIWASSGVSFPSQKVMKKGWNFVGLAELHPMPAPMALASAFFGTGEAGLWGYSQVISPSLNGASWTYMRAPDQILGLGPPLSMFPTKGYWVFMVNDGVLGGFTSTPIVEVAEPIPGPPGS